MEPLHTRTTDSIVSEVTESLNVGPQTHNMLYTLVRQLQSESEDRHMADVYAILTDTEMRREYFAQLSETSEQTDELEKWLITTDSVDIEPVIRRVRKSVDQQAA